MNLAVEQRETFGKATNILRRAGKVPAELYGRGVANLHLAVSRKDLEKAFRAAGESSVVTVRIGSESRPVLINDVSRDPVTDEIRSVDFYQVALDQTIRVKVALAFAGEAPAVKNFGGVLVKALQELEVEAFPMNIPSGIQVPLGNLTEIGTSIHVDALAVPAGVKILADPKAVVATVTAQVTEEEEISAAAAVPGVEAVKVETEEKKTERAAAKEAGAEGTETPKAGAAPAPKK